MDGVSTQAQDTHSKVAAIVARIPEGVVAEEMAAEIQSRIAAFEHLSEESRADIVGGIRRSLKRWRGLSTGVLPPHSALDQLRQWTRERVSDGIRMEDLLR